MEVRAQATTDDVTPSTGGSVTSTRVEAPQAVSQPRVSRRRSVAVPATTQSRARVTGARSTPLSRAQEYRFIRGDVRRLILTAGGLLLLMVILLMLV